MQMEGKKFASAGRFSREISALLPDAEPSKTSTIISSYTRKGVPARLTTFFVALLAGVLSTYLIRKKE